MRDQQALKCLSREPLLKTYSLVYMCMYQGFVFGFNNNTITSLVHESTIAIARTTTSHTQ